MYLSPLESSLLWLGIEDYTGLWDALHEVRSVLPNLSDLDAKHKARAIVSDLAHRNLIALYRCIGTLASGQIAEVVRGEVDSVLEDEHSWETPQAPFEESIWFAATEVGELQYHRS